MILKYALLILLMVTQLQGAGIPVKSSPMLLGSEVLAQQGFKPLVGKRIGLLTNPSGVNRQGRSTIDVLRESPGLRLVALFAPEHGVRGTILAGKEFPDAVDSQTGLPVFSLYGPGPTRKPTAKMLQQIDVLVYDLQDVGCRSYTFISTMGLAMEACGEAGVEFVVLDRPNPIGGIRVEGPGLDPRFKSLVSQWDVPYAYGLTCGELARMINGEKWIKTPCKLTVIPMRGWKRHMIWADTGLKWVPTSPMVPTDRSAMHYTALGLLGEVAKGSGLNTGGLFNRPFEFVAGSWILSAKLASAMNAYKMKGLRFKTASASHNDKPYEIVLAEYSDPARAPLVAQTVYYLEAIKAVHGRDLAKEWKLKDTPTSLFDKVAGGTQFRRDLVVGRPASGIIQTWAKNEQRFRERRRPYLLYD